MFFPKFILQLHPSNQNKTTPTHWVYVHTDFDTKEKALSGAKAAEKGLK